MGTLRGHLYAAGGPWPGHRWPLPGTVTVSGNGTRSQAVVDSDGGFSVTVPPGRYAVTGRSPHYDGGALPCPAAGPARVGAGGTTTLDVYCQMR